MSCFQPLQHRPTHILFHIPLFQCLLNVSINDFFPPFFPNHQVSGKPDSVLPTLISSKILHPKISTHLPSFPYIPYPSTPLFFPIPPYSGGVRNFPLILVSELPCLSHSPWIMPVYLPTESLFPHSEVLWCLCTTEPNRHSWKEKTHPIHSASSSWLRVPATISI